MGARAVSSPGGALLRSSRMFSMPKPLAEPSSGNLFLGEHKSDTMTRPYPQYQSITSPLSSREKGDWGLKRPLPLKTTMTTTTPLFRVKKVDSIESVTDFTSAADHSLSLEKFQEMRIPISVPASDDRYRESSLRKEMGVKSVFEEDMDFTAKEGSRNDDKRWKFKGPWLARLTEGEFKAYLDKKVRPKRAQFRELLRQRLADGLTEKQNAEAMEQGKAAPAPVLPKDVTDEQFTEYLWSLRHNRATLYALVSKFLDLAPLGKPVGVVQTGIFGLDHMKVPDSPYGLAGPPPSHPSAGISYLRTGAVMENHPIYGPQSKKSPVLSRIVHPRSGPTPARLGIGGFVAAVPPGDNDFNTRLLRGRRDRQPLAGINHLDTQSYGGGKAFVEATTAFVNPSGSVVVQTRETSAEAQLIAKEARGETRIYNTSAQKPAAPRKASLNEARIDQVAEEVLAGESAQANVPEKNIVSNSRNYGLDRPQRK